MNHLMNCHGEWNILITLIYSIPFIGIWLKLKFTKKDV
jgi:hypothetical protein